MSKRKGVSADEKRTRVLQLFYEKKEVFQLKELEKIAPKEKGVVAQAVKDVVQSLVDDGLVDTDKIGTSVYYWAFPSKATQTKRRKLEDQDSKISSANTKLTKLKESIFQSKVGREDTPERRKIIEDHERLSKERERLLAELDKYKASDPEAFKQLNADTKLAQEAANRWTDNIYCVVSWCKKKFSMEEKDLNKQFGIPPDLDYVEVIK